MPTKNSFVNIKKGIAKEEKLLPDANNQNNRTNDIELCVIGQIPAPQHALKNEKNGKNDHNKLRTEVCHEGFTISSTGNKVLMYNTFLHQYFGQLTWSMVGGSKTDSCSKYFIDTSTTPNTNMYGAVNRTKR